MGSLIDKRRVFEVFIGVFGVHIQQATVEKGSTSLDDGGCLVQIFSRALHVLVEKRIGPYIRIKH